MWIDSTAQTKDFNADGFPDDPFAEGLAIVGGPIIDCANTATFGDGSNLNPGIKGFVMAGFTGFSNQGHSNISCAGTIEGGLISTSQYYQCTDCWGPPLAYYLGSATYFGYPVVDDWLSQLEISGSANIQFKPLPRTPPGFSEGSSGVTKPTVRWWSSQ